MNIVKRVVITLSDKEQQTLKDAAQILRDCAATLDEYSGNNTGYRMENMACDLENFVEDNGEIICEEEDA